MKKPTKYPKLKHNREWKTRRVQLQHYDNAQYLLRFVLMAILKVRPPYFLVRLVRKHICIIGVVSFSFFRSPSTEIEIFISLWHNFRGGTVGIFCILELDFWTMFKKILLQIRTNRKIIPDTEIYAKINILRRNKNIFHICYQRFRHYID